MRSYRAPVTGSVQRPLLFVDVDGPLIPFGVVSRPHPTYAMSPELPGAEENPLLTRINPVGLFRFDGHHRCGGQAACAVS
jgi:hypothetical protein